MYIVSHLHRLSSCTAPPGLYTIASRNPSRPHRSSHSHSRISPFSTPQLFHQFINISDVLRRLISLFFMPSYSFLSNFNLYISSSHFLLLLPLSHRHSAISSLCIASTCSVHIASGSRSFHHCSFSLTYCSSHHHLDPRCLACRYHATDSQPARALQSPHRSTTHPQATTRTCTSLVSRLLLCVCVHYVVWCRRLRRRFLCSSSHP
ncbi:hypothetical protein C8Q73DRAFT_178760 [Cubamyces lactineus]|nr:hypothetical protein C8Q73DRAFT_178760 [Cubamyces lactineus]